MLKGSAAWHLFRLPARLARRQPDRRVVNCANTPTLCDSGPLQAVHSDTWRPSNRCFCIGTPSCCTVDGVSKSASLCRLHSFWPSVVCILSSSMPLSKRRRTRLTRSTRRDCDCNNGTRVLGRRCLNLNSASEASACVCASKTKWRAGLLEGFVSLDKIHV